MPTAPKNVAVFGSTGSIGRSALEVIEASDGRLRAIALSAHCNLERLNELSFYDATLPSAEQGFRRILVTEPTHPYLSAWWPPGHTIGYEHSFTHEVRDLMEALAADRDPYPSFSDALQVQQVLDAVERSAKSGSWTTV